MGELILRDVLIVFLVAIPIVLIARRLNPQITIVTRSRYRDHVNDFYDAGADFELNFRINATFSRFYQSKHSSLHPRLWSDIRRTLMC